MLLSCRSLLRIRNVSDKFVQKVATHFMFSNFFRRSCGLWSNKRKHDRNRQVTDDSTTRCVHFACWVTKAVDTHFECVTVLFYSNNGSTNVRQYYVYTCIDYLICILYTCVRASWIEFNNCPTRCDLFSLFYFCRQLYMFRVLTPIVRSSYNCN